MQVSIIFRCYIYHDNRLLIAPSHLYERQQKQPWSVVKASHGRTSSNARNPQDTGGYWMVTVKSVTMPSTAIPETITVKARCR